MVCDDELEICWNEDDTIADILAWLNEGATDAVSEQ